MNPLNWRTKKIRINKQLHTRIFLNDRIGLKKWSGSWYGFHDPGHFPEFNGRISENKADFPAAADVAVIIHPDIEKNKKNGGAWTTRGHMIDRTAAADALSQRMGVHAWFICRSEYRLSFLQLQAFKGFLDDVLSHFKYWQWF